MTTDVLTVRGLRKRYRGRRGALANDGIDLDVPHGSIVGLLGRNGAGKTTLINQIIGLTKPDAGTIRLDGIDAVAKPHLARRKASMQAQANAPISGLTPRIAIQLVGRMRGAPKDLVVRRTRHLLDVLDIGPWADVPAQKISGGIARLTAFAMTAVVPGELVVLDEPTTDIDPIRRALVWDRIRALASDGHGVLVATHNVREAERAIDRVAILDHGTILAAGTPAELTAELRGTVTVEIDLVGDSGGWHPAVTPVRIDRNRRVGTVPVGRAAEVVDWAHHLIIASRIERYRLTPASLEDVYVNLIGPRPVPAPLATKPPAT